MIKFYGSGPTRDSDGNFYLGDSKIYKYLYPPNNTFLVEDLNPGNWLCEPQIYFRNGAHITLPSTDHPAGYQRFTVPENDTGTIEVNADLVSVGGAFDLGHVVRKEDIKKVGIQLQGVRNTTTHGGWSNSFLDTLNHRYNLALTPGDWKLTHILSHLENINPSQDEDYLNCKFIHNTWNNPKHPISSFSVAAENDITDHDLNYEPGQITINYSAVDGGIFYDPYLVGECFEYNDPNLRVGLTQKRFDAQGPTGPTTLGTVTAVGFPGIYGIRAYAWVDNSRSQFGSFDVEIEPGVKKEIELNGPVLIMSEPEANACIATTSVVVSGIATDNEGVTAVTVDGVAVTLVSTNNPDDPNEIQFSTTVSLSPGENIIEIIAYDATDKTGAELRTVRYDSAPPQITITGVSEGAEYTDRASAYISVNDAACGVASETVLLDGEPYTSGTTIAGKGPHTLEVHAVDSAGNSAQSTVAFTIFATTELSVTTDGGQYSDPTDLSATLTSGGTPAAGQTVTFTVDGTAVGSAVTDEAGMATLAYNIAKPNGSYLVAAAFARASQDYLLASNASSYMEVSPEDATISYISSLQVKHPNPFTLVARVDQSADGALGNLSLARVIFDVDRVDGDGSLIDVDQFEVQCDAHGVAQTSSQFDVGVYTITATIAEDGYFEPANHTATAPSTKPST
jgi:hypothetical protein